MQKLITLVDKRMDAGFSPETESSIDNLVTEMYGLRDAELQELGIT